MKPRIPLPRTLAARAFTIQQGKDAGLTVKRLRGRDLQRPFPGVRVCSVLSLDVRALASALQAKLPTDAYFSGVTAAVVMGFPLPARLEAATSLHVAIPSPRAAPRGAGIIGHSVSTAGGDVREWSGIRISTPPRTWCELASVLSMPDLVAVGDYLVSVDRPLTTVGRLQEEVARNPRRRGARKLLRALELLDGRAESRPESLLRVIFVTARLPEVTANLPIRTSDGYHYRGDLVFREKKVIVEYQSDYHAGSEQFRRDMTRISRLQADGWLVVQVNARDLDNPAELVSRIGRILDSR